MFAKVMFSKATLLSKQSEVRRTFTKPMVEKLAAKHWTMKDDEELYYLKHLVTWGLVDSMTQPVSNAADFGKKKNQL